MGSAQLDLFGAPVVSEPARGRGAGSKPRTSGPTADDPGRSAALLALAPEDAEAVEWCEQECARVLAEAKRAKRRKREPTEDSESARVVREEMSAPQCPHHGPAFICPACAECGDTDGCGFLHRQVCKGRIPLRACAQCGQLRTHGRWNHSDWRRCLDCVPLGKVLMEQSRALTNNRQASP